MNDKSLSKIYIWGIAVVLIAIGGFLSNRRPLSAPDKELIPLEISSDVLGGLKKFEFNNFHEQPLGDSGFAFQYPADWFNEGQYFSPQRIEYYDLYSVRAAFYFDLIRTDIFEDTEFKYQIDQSKRNSPDTIGKIDGKDFKRYDLIDYGSYGGASAGRVIVYVGPKISIDNKLYYLVLHFEEKPLASSLDGNDPDVFEKVVQSLKFVQ